MSGAPTGCAMNLLDILIILFLVSAFVVIFFAGLWKALASLAALWVGLVGADIFGNLLGSLLHGIIPGIERWTADLIGFVLSFLIVAGIILYLALRSFRTISERSGYRLDIRGGLPVLLATVFLACVVSIASVTVVIELASRTISDIPPGERPDFVTEQFHEAAFRPATEQIADYIYDATGSWVPGGTPSVLAPED